MKLQEVLDEMVHQLDWRGPTGKTMGHIVLGRDDAAVLVREVCDMKVEATKVVAFDPDCGCPCCNINTRRFGTAEIDGT